MDKEEILRDEYISAKANLLSALKENHEIN